LAAGSYQFVTIDPVALDDRVERVNITLPRTFAAARDNEARAAGERRAGYIAKLAIGEKEHPHRRSRLGAQFPLQF
jgi:hypothetical protein